MNAKQRGKVFKNEKGFYYVRTAKLNKDVRYNRSLVSYDNMLTIKKGTRVVFMGECEIRKEEGRKRLYSFKFPDGQTFPLWEEEFTWEKRVIVTEVKRCHEAELDTYPTIE